MTIKDKMDIAATILSGYLSGFAVDTDRQYISRQVSKVLEYTDELIKQVFEKYEN